MSGFAGVFHLDGTPVDRAWLEAMADFLAFRGPDARHVWCCGHVGLCHTLLHTSDESRSVSQVASLDDRTWITGDVRIDDRETLVAKLSGGHDLKGASGAELLLRAYGQWGDACVQHLLGDFSFVIWDAPHRRVFAARDHLGVKPLYYAKIGSCLLISNTQDCLRQVPIVADELNEQAIGDFLIIGENKNPQTTFFAKVQRLPAAHRLACGGDGLHTTRYWTLPIDEPVYYKRRSDYVDRFHEHLRLAVRDRLPDGPLGILMSGGLDSPALAATAAELGGAPTAFTSVFDRLIPDEERHYAGLVAQHIGIPIYYTVRDDEVFSLKFGSDYVQTAAPSADPLSLRSAQQYHRSLSIHARRFFFGDGPDGALLYEWRSHLTHLIGKGMWWRLCRDLGFHFAVHRRIPLLPTLPRMWRERRDPNRYQFKLPQWLNKEFEGRLRLGERWEEIHRETPSPHPVRPRGYASFASDFPMDAADDMDAGRTGVPVEFLHPFCDLRLVRFLLSVPAVPWCREKYLIRTALQGLIPEAVRLRPKSPSALTYVERATISERPELPSTSRLSRYVDVEMLPGWPGRDREEHDYTLRALGLQYWLLGLH